MNVGASGESRRTRAPAKKTVDRPALSLLAWALGLLLIVLTGVSSLWFVVPAAWEDAGTLRARTLISDWREGKGPAVTAELWNTMRNDLTDAALTSPGNAQFQDDLGFLYAARSQGMGVVPVGSPARELQLALMDVAVGYYRAAARLRPTFPYSWTYLALALHLHDRHDEEFWAAFDRGMRYGNSEAALQPVLAQIAFAQWPEIGVERQKKVIDMVASAKEASRKNLLAMAERAGVVLPP